MITGLLWFFTFFIAFGALAYHYSRLPVWTAATAGLLLIYGYLGSAGWLWLSCLWVIAALIFLPLNVRPLRRKVTQKIFTLYRQLMPEMSRTEKEALTAGTVSWEGDLFSGRPDWQAFLKKPAGRLTAEEQAFIAGPVETVCEAIDDWEITHELADLPETVWTYLKKERFLGMIIPKAYGGLEFSATAVSTVLSKLYSRSITLGTTVCVPNSLGPAELLLKYGTDEQKQYYLPRLAVGEEIPCFGLTSPSAGSDAASIPDIGTVCKGQWEGREVVGIKLNWDKRYITLAPVATVLGIAFRLFDPEHLIGKIEDRGITCALIPADTKGVVTGRRHFPLNTGFLNGPTQGHDVFIPIEWIIGGADRAGDGWRMLMECLSAGRAISLPSSAVGSTQMAALASGAYARIRKQFNLPIGRFEGVAEVLGQIGGYTYITSAGLKFTAAAIDNGSKPAVASAILKYHTTEMSRQVGLWAMDVHGGKGICLGPNNYLGRGYQGAPIGITVEGANILSRSLIIFGQGAIRCHPFVFAELQAAEKNDLKAFDKALLAHVGDIISNSLRSLWFGMTRAKLARVPASPIKRYMQLVTWYSSSFAFASEVAMLSLGADLKRKESLSARLGDILSLLYLASSVIKQYADDGYPEADKPLVQWSCHHLFFTIQQRFDAVIKNFPNRAVGMVMRMVIYPFGMHLHEPTDKATFKISELLMYPNPTRERLTSGVHKTPCDLNPIGRMENALRAVLKAEKLEKRLQEAVKAGKVKSLGPAAQLEEVAKLKIFNPDELQLLHDAFEARQWVVAVDDFDNSELKRGDGESTQSTRAANKTKTK